MIVCAVTTVSVVMMLRDFGSYEIELRLHNITSKASLYYDSENWIINKGHAQKLQAAQIRFLRPLLGLTRLDCHRNPDIRNRLKVDNIVEDKKIVRPKETVRPPGTNG
jgi:hypothetical protein